MYGAPNVPEIPLGQIEGGKITSFDFLQLVPASNDLAQGWSTSNGSATLFDPGFSMPVGGRIAWTVADLDPAGFGSISTGGFSSIVPDSGNRPWVASMYVLLQAYPHNQSRFEFTVGLADASSITFTVDFDPRNGQLISSVVTSTVVGYDPQGCSVVIEPFAEAGLSAVRVNLIIDTPGLVGAQSPNTGNISIFPDTQTTGGLNSIVVNCVQIAVPIGEITVADFGIPQYVPGSPNQSTGNDQAVAQTGKIIGSALDLSYRFTLPNTTTPIPLDLYAHLGATLQVINPGGTQFSLPPTAFPSQCEYVPNGWFCRIGGMDQFTFDIIVAAGQTLVFGGATPPIVGPATHTVPAGGGVVFYKVMQIDRFGTFALIPDTPLASALGGGLQLYAENPVAPVAPIAGGANSVAIGSGAVTVDPDSFAFGTNANAQDEQDVAIGRNSIANGLGFATGSANAVGAGAEATGRSSAFGTLALATSDGGTAVGNQSIASATAGASLGFRAEVSGAGSNGTCVGSNSRVTNTEGVCLGQNLLASHANSQVHGAAVASQWTGHFLNGMAMTAFGTIRSHSAETFLAGGTPAAAPLVLTTVAAGTIVPPLNCITHFEGEVLCERVGLEGTIYAVFEIRRGVIINNGGLMTMVVAPVITTLVDTVPGATVAAIANNVADTLDIVVTGVAATNLRWSAWIRTKHITRG